MGLASILVRLGLDSTGYSTGLKRAESMTTSWGRRISSSVKGYLATAFSAAVVTAATRSIVAWADSIQDLSDDLGISVKTLQEWQWAASGTRASLDDFVRSFQFLARQNENLTKPEVLDLFNKYASAYKNGAMTLGELQDKLGRSSAVLSGPFTKGLSDAAKEAARLGVLLRDGQIKDLADLADSWDRAKLRMKLYFAGLESNVVEWWNRGDRRDLARNTERMLDPLLNKLKFGGGVGMAGQGGIFGAIYQAVMGLPSPDKPWARSAEWVGPTLPPSTAQAQTLSEDAKARSSWSASSLTANQQVGAFVAAQPIVLTEIKEQTKVLRDIRKLAESIDDKS